MKQEFPINVFPDVERNAFNKYTKKNVTEDYIYENLELKGWKCYKPFVDTGIDLIATKQDKKGRQLYRYIQIKTRELSQKNFFGYTLRPKDFRTDPRHYFLFFCDTLNDIILISMYDYMKLFYDNKEMGISHFANPTFRTNNNKLNSLKYTKGQGWTWTYKTNGSKKTVSFNNYVNINGIEKMEDTFLEDNFDALKKEIAKMKFDMFYKINTTKTNHYLMKEENIIKSSLEQIKNISAKDYINNIREIEKKYQTEFPTLYTSHKRYIYGCFEEENGGTK